MMEASTGNLMVSEAGLVLAEHRLLDNVPNGLGDLFSALFLARLVEGRKPEKALQTATASVSKSPPGPCAKAATNWRSRANPPASPPDGDGAIAIDPGTGRSPPAASSRRVCE